MRHKLSFLAILFTLASCARAEWTTRQWTVEDLTREAIVVTPEDATTTAAPVIFAFHGHGGRIRGFARSLALEKRWPEAIVVYPQGVPTPGQLTDKEGKLPGWQSKAGAHGDRDLKFVDAMLESLERDYKIDKSRIYAAGHSNGATFTYLLWQARNQRFAAFAPAGSVLAVGPRADHKLADVRPRPILHIAGKADPLVKFQWQRRTIDLLRRHNRCTDGRPWEADERCTIYPSADNVPVIAYIYEGGHPLPQDAADVIVKFFKASTTATTRPSATE
jgi:polyhydroxybutyrate depolymerase